MARVVLAMSGGVDSSAAAHLLLAQGHEVIGVFMRHGEESPVACNVSGEKETACGLAPKNPPLATRHSPLLPIVERADHKQGCCTAADAEDARRVADRLDIPFYALNLQAEFGQIIDYFVAEYSAGRTPNPCVMCNNWIKFGKLFDYADSVGAEFVATGHYAQLFPSAAGEMQIHRGVDAGKDQSYVLFGIERHLLRRMLLPVGGYQKSEIRALAAQIGLRVADKRDSQEICFVTSGKHFEFIKAKLSGEENAARGLAPKHTPLSTLHTPLTPGEFVTTEGRVVGRHEGIERFTVGQRKGLGIALGEPYFVVRIEPETRRVVLGRKEDLARGELTATATNWHIDPPQPGDSPRPCYAQIRYNSRPVKARLQMLANDRLHVTFDEPCYGVAPGQAVVCYEGNRVLGGGWIE